MNEHTADNDAWRYCPSPVGVFAEERLRGGAFGRRPSLWRRLWTRVIPPGVMHEEKS